MAFLNAFFSAALDENIVFSLMVGMVAVLVVARRPQDSFSFGGNVWLASFIAGLFGWALYSGFLKPWGVGYLAPAVYALVACAAVFVIALIKGDAKPEGARNDFYARYGLLALSAVVLGVPVVMGMSFDNGTLTTLDAALGQMAGYGCGFFVAVVAFAFIHQRIDETMVPKALRGLPIDLVTLALMALAFTGVAGIAAGMFA